MTKQHPELKEFDHKVIVQEVGDPAGIWVVGGIDFDDSDPSNPAVIMTLHNYEPGLDPVPKRLDIVEVEVKSNVNEEIALEALELLGQGS